MSEKTKEEEAFQAHKKRFEWLELVTNDGASMKTQQFTKRACELPKQPALQLRLPPLLELLKNLHV